ncbi:hypothetical protein CbuRSA461_08045 [Coxiella burnetii]|nr:hypothetical protein [Coxiella burnetii]POZ76718.1 hypothetical protein CbuRSA461_08045 [Coxiella burnetii]
MTPSLRGGSISLGYGLLSLLRALIVRLGVNIDHIALRQARGTDWASGSSERNENADRWSAIIK